MKQLTKIAGIFLIILSVFSSCTKMGIENQKEFSKGNLLYRWSLVYYIDSKHDTTFASKVPCLQDDWIVFYANNSGHVVQGDCINYPGKAKDVSFRFEQVGISRWKLTSWAAGVYANGLTWFSEGSNNADLHGEGEFLFIVETSPNYQEWKYKKISD